MLDEQDDSGTPQIASIGTLRLPPDAGGTARAFSRIGYEFEQAVADVIDNAVDAGAAHVDVTLVRTASELVGVSIADDGSGMDADALRTGMTFGAATPRPAKLGAFGMGLKAASLSQCRSLSVLTRDGTTMSACRWTMDSLREWRCELLEPQESNRRFALAYGLGRAPNAGGTCVLWQDLDRLGTGRGEGDLDEFLHRLLSQLDVHLGLVFHRFLVGRKLSIQLAVQRLGQRGRVPRPVRARDPFNHPRSGHRSYPETLRADVPGIGRLDLRAHVWPAASGGDDFLLGRRTATAAQGIYFYRNDRLIQAGGWNGLVGDARDPELSLARVAVELPDGGFDVNVQKSQVQITAAAAEAFAAARSGDRGWAHFLDAARQTHRAARRARRAAADGVVVTPGAGFPAAVRKRGDALVGTGAEPRELAFAWTELAENRLFEVVGEDDVVLLNARHRSRVVGGRGSAADAPIVKTLLLLLLERDLDSFRTSRRRAEWLDRCNALLLAAVAAS